MNNVRTPAKSDANIYYFDDIRTGVYYVYTTKRHITKEIQMYKTHKQNIEYIFLMT